MAKKQGYTTSSVHTPFVKDDAYSALHMPIYDGVAYEFESSLEMEKVFTGQKVAHVYSRTSNPTVGYFEEKLKRISGAKNAMSFSSGMAAITTTLLSIVPPGGNIVSSNQLFGHTYAFLKSTIQRWNIQVKFVDMNNLAQVAAAIDKQTGLLFFETITNPQLEIFDIEALAALAHSNNIPLVADSTLTPPYVFNSLDAGVDVEVISTTKFISGGAAAVGGAILDNGSFDWSNSLALKEWDTNFPGNALMARIRKEMFRHLGGSMTAHTAHFLILGLDTLALRVDRCVENCMALGKYFEQHTKVVAVNYPGLKSSVGYARSKKYFSGKPGAVMTIDLKTKESCYQFMDGLKMVRRATNLNDNKTLIIHPSSTIYAEFSDTDRENMALRDTMLRLSVGIEDVQDLIEDFKQAFYIV
ncbi:O-acetylhomoserine (thiol)-lyase [Saccharicrinis carchari]|uniref:O-acetylhomoserine (Thiol)-lyase n=1 Tax=Saccharicrinis carchari TaxID=1168039 RepID=A0A521EQF0_SACCC|nr:PLP-dependent transferase [Saccharicrinis carchari]SMO86156.1 O-acetylhomoserine (thiol)-lyase [Saccharicrinis carchari]